MSERQINLDAYTLKAGQKWISHDLFETSHLEGEPCDECGPRGYHHRVGDAPPETNKTPRAD